MQTAKVAAQIVTVTCPVCDDPILSPNDSSYDWTSDSDIPNVIVCDCGARLRMPKVAGMFVNRK